MRPYRFLAIAAFSTFLFIPQSWAQISIDKLLSQSDGPQTVQLSPTDQENIVRSKQLVQLIYLLQHRYYDQSKVKDVDALYNAMIKSLWDAIGDKHADYYGPEDRTLQEALAPDKEFFGIGVGLFPTPDKTLEIYKVLPGGPAEKAHVKVGDIIVGVGNTDISGMAIDKIVDLIKGPKDTPVVVKFKHADGSVEPKAMIREPVSNTNVSVIKHGDILEIRIDEFSESVTDDIKSQVARILGQGVAPKGVILDLRNDPGGLLTQGIAVYDLFGTKKGVKIVTEKDGFGNTHSDYTTRDHSWTCPLVVLVNKDSASASEIVSGALQANGRATIIGTHSYKKGSVQESMPLIGGASTKFTIAHFFVGEAEKTVDGVGIEPDIKVEQNTPINLTTDKEKALYVEHAMLFGDTTQDNVLKAAIDFLNHKS